MSLKAQDCPRCGVSARLQKRTFSDQAASALIVWGDISQDHVGQAICENCYRELRDILIDRSADLSTVDTSSITRAS